MRQPILPGNERIAYRDPACIFSGGVFYLFMTVSEREGGYLYNRVGVSESRDLVRWSESRLLTPRDRTLNYCSPGNITRVGDEYVICVCSYPMPLPYSDRDHADDSARLFFIRTSDFREYSTPEWIPAKGDLPRAEVGRMIDPYLLRDKDDGGLFHLFFKQNGVSRSHSRDLRHFVYDGHTGGGENACVLVRDGAYYLIHSPENGIGVKRSLDLATWEDLGLKTLGQENLPWANGRITAGFALELPEGFGHRFALFFHGSRADVLPETHGAASLGLMFSDDLLNFTD